MRVSDGVRGHGSGYVTKKVSNRRKSQKEEEGEDGGKEEGGRLWGLISRPSFSNILWLCTKNECLKTLKYLIKYNSFSAHSVH